MLLLLSGTGNPRVQKNPHGYGYGHEIIPATGMGFLTGTILSWRVRIWVSDTQRILPLPSLVAFIHKYGNFSLLSYIVREEGRSRDGFRVLDSSCSSQQVHQISTHTVSVVQVRLQKMAKPQDDLSFDMLTHLAQQRQSVT